MLNRRDTLVLAAAASVASLAGVRGALAQDVNIDMLMLMAPKGISDKVMGSPDAKVLVIEYASPTCPHCALFANNVFPEFKTRYIDSGKVKFILRPFVRNLLDSVIFMLAEAAADAADPGPGAAISTTPDATPAAPATPAPVAGAPKVYSEAAVAAYEAVIATYFRTQDTWALSDKPGDAILEVAKQLGFTEESFNAALTNQALADGMNEARTQAMDDFKLTGTPTFFVNGKQLVGEKSIEDMAAAIDPLLA